jgi:hypothetical protein
MIARDNAGSRHTIYCPPFTVRVDPVMKPRMAKKLNLQESRVVVSCLYSLTACRPVEL